MKTAQRIRQLRMASAISAEAIAERIGLSVEAYEDLERFDDELATAVSIHQVQRLAQELGVEAWALFAENPPSEPQLNGTSILQTLEQYRAATELTLGELEEEAGWELHDFRVDPDRIIQSCPAMFLQEVASVIKLKWLRLLPSTHAA